MTDKRILIAVSTFLFLLGLASANGQTYSVLYNFGSMPGDPLNPGSTGAIAQGRDGNLYSSATVGGAYGYGAVFKITPSGQLTVLHSFDGSDGYQPIGGLTLGTDGNFYGTTYEGGTTDNGTIFKITPTGGLTTLYNFTGGDDGFGPVAPPIEGIDGNFYGTVEYNGAEGFGTAYKITPSGKFTVLYGFGAGDGGDSPLAPLVQGFDGEFYGTTELGGSSFNGGVIYRLSASGKYNVIWTFAAPDGANPHSPLVQAPDGSFYGTTSAWGSGTNGPGTIFTTTRNGDFNVLYNFNGITDGGSPYAGLTLATDGNFYGAAVGAFFTKNYGTLFDITPAGAFSVLHTFDDGDGANPCVTPVQHTNGILYGDTVNGGTSVGGVFYSLDNGLEPFVSFLPGAGVVGSKIQLLGQGFTGATKVSFNGVPAKFKVIEDTFLGAFVPAGAKTGFVTVTTPGGVLKSNKKFIVIP